MRRFWPLLLFVIMLAIVWLAPQQRSPEPDSASVSDYHRIISLSPSITETLCALGAGERLMAVTDYCDYPPGAQALPSVGGYTDTSLEAIISQQPDLVIMLKGQQKLRQQLAELSIMTHSVDNSTLLGIQAGIASIGKITGQHKQAEALLADIQHGIDEVTGKLSDQPPVRTLISIAHYVNSAQLETVYVAGQHDFYHDLLQLAGGENAYTGSHVMVPSVSREGIMRMDPDVIIDIFPDAKDHQSDMELVKQQWQDLETVSAVQSDRVHIIERDYASVPGPRVFQLLPLFARLLHPQLRWPEVGSHD